MAGLERPGAGSEQVAETDLKRVFPAFLPVTAPFATRAAEIGGGLALQAAPPAWIQIRGLRPPPAQVRSSLPPSARRDRRPTVARS